MTNDRDAELPEHRGRSNESDLLQRHGTPTAEVSSGPSESSLSENRDEPPCPLASVSASLDASVRYLSATQHPAGSWTDFWLPVGTSDAWVTAYVGLAMECVSRCWGVADRTARRARSSALRAGRWSAANRRRDSGWGYNATVAADADSTAHAISLLAKLDFEVPSSAVAFLRRHEVPGRGYRTYLWRDPEHRWTAPSADLTASSLRALSHAGVLSQTETAVAWTQLLLRDRDQAGCWSGYWWPTPNYPTSLTLEVWDLAGRPRCETVCLSRLSVANSFEVACAIQAAAFWDPAGARPGLARLIQEQHSDGSWPNASILRVPPARKSAHIGNPQTTTDSRRLFTTATAMRALAIHLQTCRGDDRHAKRPSGRPWSQCTRSLPKFASTRSAVGQRLDETLRGVAAAGGLPNHEIETAACLFQELTRESLQDPTPWPSSQLSSLANGFPVEFSVRVGASSHAGLRYATEIGHPTLPPWARARSGLQVMCRAARRLGYDRAWTMVATAVRSLVSPKLSAPDGLRFWVWGGVDHRSGPGSDHCSPLLKIYINTLNRAVGQVPERVQTCLSNLGVEPNDAARQVLHTLSQAGFVQQVGLGLGPNSRIAVKVYYELPGWSRMLIRQLLEFVDLPDETDRLCPEISGILRETLAAKSRAGVSVRLDPNIGSVCELTTTAAFPTPWISLADTTARVAEWLQEQGWNADGYLAAASHLWPNEQVVCRAAGVRGHGLITRTMSHRGDWASIYMRPLTIDRTAVVGSESGDSPGASRSRRWKARSISDDPRIG